MVKKILALGIFSAMMIFGSSAFAGPFFNGPYFNGFKINGIIVNGNSLDNNTIRTLDVKENIMQKTALAVDVVKLPAN